MATCALLAVAGSAAAEGNWHMESGALEYSEQGRVSVFEPVIGLKRDLTNGRSLAAKVIFDVMTGASPTGATPSDKVQTVTSASGNSQQVRSGVVPLGPFKDHRAAVELDYEQPLARTLKVAVGGHLSQETDYASRGGTFTITWDTPDRLTTLMVGAGGNFDRVFPKGGMRTGLALSSDAPMPGVTADKQAIDGLIGVSRVLSAHWLMKLNYGHARESGYLTEPYKIVSILDADGNSIDYRNENRPNQRKKENITLSSVYAVDEDVLHFSYRFFWDDWGVRSHTVDVKYRFDVAEGNYLEPHLRLYTQSAVNFYSYGLMSGAPLPRYATADYRYGKMNSQTIGAKYGVETGSGEFNIQFEYMIQSGPSHPPQAIGVQTQSDLFPSVSITIIQVGYSLDF
jgi:hypothetical protein